MLSKGSVGGEEVSYSEVAPKLETVVSTGRSDCTFRYCKDGKNLNSWSCEDSPCVWQFVVSEGDFKASDVTLGRTFSLQSVDFIVDLIPHKCLFIHSIIHRPPSFVLPPHIFGALFPTPGGRTILREIIQLQSMCAMMEDENELLQNRRAVLWSLAHIAVLPKGLLFLKNHGRIDLLPSLTHMAHSDNSLTMRGSCLLVLSVLASNPDLHAPLQKLGWNCDATNHHSICLPQEFESFFSDIISTDNWTLPQCDHFTRTSHHHRKDLTQTLPPSVTARSSGIMKSISYFTSSTTADSSVGSSMGSRRARTSSTNSVDSHGNNHIDVTFDDDTHHYDKSQECPSDILLTDLSDHRDIIDLIQKISRNSGIP